MIVTGMVAGLGCRKGTSVESLLAALDAACAKAGIGRSSIAALATGEIKRNEPGILALAQELALPLHVLGEVELKQAEDRTETVSRHSIEQAGTPSLSEAAALALAGDGSQLVVSRLIVDGATCALARSKQQL